MKREQREHILNETSRIRSEILGPDAMQWTDAADYLIRLTKLVDLLALLESQEEAPPVEESESSGLFNYPLALQAEMRQAIADLVEWDAMMGRHESNLWGLAKNVIERVRNYEDASRKLKA